METMTDQKQKNILILKKYLMADICDFLFIREIQQLSQTNRKIRSEILNYSRRYKIYIQFINILKKSKIFENSEFSLIYRNFFENDTLNNFIPCFNLEENCEIFNKFYFKCNKISRLDLHNQRISKFPKLPNILKSCNCKFESINTVFSSGEEMKILCKIIKTCDVLKNYSLENIDIESPEIIPLSQALGESVNIQELYLSLTKDFGPAFPNEAKVKLLLDSLEKNKNIVKFYLTGKNTHRFFNFISNNKSIKHLIISHYNGIYDFLLKNESIEKLEFKANFASPVNVLDQILQSKTSKIKTLIFNNCDPKTFNNELLLSKMTKFPELIFTNFNQKIEDKLKIILSLLKDNRYVKKVTFTNVKIGNQMLEYILDVLKNNECINQIDVSNNEININHNLVTKIQQFISNKNDFKKFTLFEEEENQINFQNLLYQQLQLQQSQKSTQ